jgi:hypothetical protein
MAQQIQFAPPQNVFGAFMEGREARQRIDANQFALDENRRASAMKTLETVGSVALGAMGGNLDGQPDPKLFEDGLSLLEQQGLDVKAFRGKAHLAPLVVRSSMDAIQSLSYAKTKQDMENAQKKFLLDMKTASASEARETQRHGLDMQIGQHKLKQAGVQDTREAQRFAWEEADRKKPAAPNTDFGKAKRDLDAGYITPEQYAELTKGATKDQPNDVREYEYMVRQMRERGVPDDKIPTFLEYSKPKSKGFSFTHPDGTVVQFGGTDGGGGTAAGLSGEIGSRLGLGRSFLENDYPGIIKIIKSGGATGPLDYTKGRFGRGESGVVQRRMASGVDALRRNLTGQGMAVAEASDYAARYQPEWSDNAEILASKAAGLKRDLLAVDAGAVLGKSGLLELNGTTQFDFDDEGNLINPQADETQTGPGGATDIPQTTPPPSAGPAPQGPAPMTGTNLETQGKNFVRTKEIDGITYGQDGAGQWWLIQQ